MSTPTLERAAAIKKQQTDLLSSIPLRTLHIGLWIRSDPPRLNDFHWGFYLHTSATSGMKYHVSSLTGGWIPEHGPNSVLKSNFFCVLIQIASVVETNLALLDNVMRTHDKDMNGILGVTCRVWLVMILEKLVQGGMVRCENLQALEEECMAFGNEYSASAAVNEQPRPVVKSRLCL
ncbi:hypothetical protein N7508_002963 [Penicillium antarcticum]|uniref:uncharacterized protein n=1 Tax=Penicillium antarcticum TaxID=416450 RepID=UPI00238EE868|nr:uncharacterized protein N7508_002963 [Penicillium antarcticum]KAJ5312133.1 hypothetical protein N7508_002963 [Penicillium antarcticum]